MTELKFSCPDCGQHLAYEERLVGQQIECPACHHSIVAPLPGVGPDVAGVCAGEPLQSDTGLRTLPWEAGPARVSDAPPARGPEPASLALATAPTEAELRAFVGRNAEYYLAKWSLALAGNRQRGGAGCNWAAFLFLGCWLPYRKLYAAAFWVWGGALLIGIGSAVLPQLASVSPSIIGIVTLAMTIAFAGSANQLYLAKARKTVGEARAERLSRQEHLAALAQRGGTSLLAGLVFPLAFVLAVGGGSFALQSAGFASPYGKRLTFNSGELYYRPPVTEAQARKLGEYLVQAQYFAGTRATVQLLLVGAIVQFRAVVKQGAEREPKNVEMFGMFGEQISKAVFDGMPVEVHLCDPKLQTLLSVPAGK